MNFTGKPKDIRFGGWTPLQDEILKAEYPTRGVDKALKSQLKRSDGSIRYRAGVLGLKTNKSLNYHKGFGKYEELTGEYMGQVRRNSVIREIPFCITPKQVWDQYILQNKKCAYCNRDISFLTKTASIDRIDSKLGYYIDNIQIVHKVINNMKSSLPEEHFLSFINDIFKHRIEIRH